MRCVKRTVRKREVVGVSNLVVEVRETGGVGVRTRSLDSHFRSVYADRPARRDRPRQTDRDATRTAPDVDQRHAGPEMWQQVCGVLFCATPGVFIHHNRLVAVHVALAIVLRSARHPIPIFRTDGYYRQITGAAAQIRNEMLTTGGAG